MINMQIKEKMTDSCMIYPHVTEEDDNWQVRAIKLPFGERPVGGLALASGWRPGPLRPCGVGGVDSIDGMGEKSYPYPVLRPSLRFPSIADWSSANELSFSLSHSYG